MITTVMRWLGYQPVDKAPSYYAREGDVVLYYSCDGCMAEDHRLMWVGRVVGVGTEPYTHPSMAKYTKVVVEVIKRGNQDFRDKDLRFEEFCREDGCAQRLADNLIIIFK